MRALTLSNYHRCIDLLTGRQARLPKRASGRPPRNRPVNLHDNPRPAEENRRLRRKLQRERGVFWRGG